MDSNAGSVCESVACKENIICRLQRVKGKNILSSGILQSCENIHVQEESRMNADI